MQENPIDPTQDDYYLKDFYDFFEKTLNDIILLISGYHEFKNSSPVSFFFREEPMITEITAIQTAVISSIASLFGGTFKIPALALEYFVNNRLQSEMIFQIAAIYDKSPNEEIFLKCLSGIDEESFSKMEVSDHLITHLSFGYRLVAKDIFRNASSSMIGGFIGDNKENPILNSFLSGLFTYFETRNISIVTKKRFS